MATMSVTSDIRAWARGAGLPVQDKGALSNDVKEAYLEAHQDDVSPDDRPVLDDLDESPGSDAVEELQADPPPKRGESAGGRVPRAPRKSARVTLAVKKDVKAKVQMLLLPGAAVYQARDPLCGGAFAEAVPDVADAMVDIICDSPDLLNWFIGGTGCYMKYFGLVTALMPWATVAFAHHVTHAITLEPPDEQAVPDWSMYGAPAA
jgi:hypothetical protein